MSASVGETCSRKSFLLSLKRYLCEWFEYYVAFENDIRDQMLCIISLKVLIDLSFMTTS